MSGWRGDCKSSTYFLHTARSFPLRHDFYLTRWFDPGRRTWQEAAVLQPWVWAGLNGEPQATTLEKVLAVFPGAAEVTTSDGTLIVVPYEIWKDRVKRYQAAKQEIRHGNTNVGGS